MKCFKCGTDSAQDSEICSNCGHQFETKCPACAEFIKTEALKCRYCGEVFNTDLLKTVVKKKQEQTQALYKTENLTTTGDDSSVSASTPAPNMETVKELVNYARDEAEQDPAITANLIRKWLREKKQA